MVLEVCNQSLILFFNSLEFFTNDRRLKIPGYDDLRRQLGVDEERRLLNVSIKNPIRLLHQHLGHRCDGEGEGTEAIWRPNRGDGRGTNRGGDEKASVLWIWCRAQRIRALQIMGTCLMAASLRTQGLGLGKRGKEKTEVEEVAGE
ncbi:uncharacterized protein A4U43_C03F30340 [Asparagus officinalis]|uniref:Uncharacterized protein n=1 Tax=Asparagus officinalis TaxID=4686 RepID=A0A5P1FJ69_ASPOF|nr:uncharacterized protein A4U43_C03F30340 [Asparagus officinalis]